MNCTECRQQTEAYFDGELDARTTESIATHLAACDLCASLLDELEREAEVYKSYERDIELSPALWTAIETRLASEPAKRQARQSHFTGRLRAWLAGLIVAPRVAFGATTAVVLVCLIAVSLYQSRRGTTTLREIVSASRETEPASGASGSVTKSDAQAVLESQSKNYEPVSRKNESFESAIHARIRPNIKGENEAKVRVISTRNHVVTRAELTRNRRRVEPQSTNNLPLANSVESFPTLAAITERRNEVEPQGGFEGLWRRHAEQSQLLLRSFRNTHVRGKSVDVAYERAQARRLLTRNVVLRRDAGRRGRVLTAETLSRLEPVLLDIANLPAKTSPEDVRAVNSRIGAGELVATLNAQSTFLARTN